MVVTSCLQAYFTIGGHTPPNFPSLGGYLEPNLIRHSLDPPDSTTHSAPASDQPSLYTPRTLFFPYTLQWGFSPPKFPLPLGDPAPDLTHCYFGQPQSTPQTASRSVQPFYSYGISSRPILYNGAGFGSDWCHY